MKKDTTKEEIKLLKRLKEIVSEEIHPIHTINDMDLDCPECKAAVFVSFINSRINTLEYGEK